MRKIASKLMLLFIVFAVSFSIATILVKPALKLYSYTHYHRSYVENIYTPSYGKLTELFLAEFNAMADGGIVIYSKNTRPISIQEMTPILELLYPYAIGLANALPNRCDIYIRSGLDILTYRETLFHEYLHCFGYMHKDDKNDLMYYSMYPIDKEENIRYYARDVKRKFYEPRFYRF